MIELEAGADGQVLIRMARPPVNALDRTLLEEIDDAFARAIEGGASAIVLSGSGSCFSAGIDTKLAARATREEQIESIRAINRMVATIYAAPVPVVAAVNGHALGGGLVIALACDMRLASRGPHKLALNEVAAGVPFPAGPLRVVSAELDPTVLRDLCLTGRTVGPDEAMQLRLLDEVLDAEDLLTRSLELARELASHPAYGAVKSQLRARVAEELHRIADGGEDPMLEKWLAP
jgi:enoyl-CoA hydratase